MSRGTFGSQALRQQSWLAAAEQAACVRGAAGLFRHSERAVVAVTGGDRVRWLDGMLSGDVAGLRPGHQRSGCYALALTRQGRIVADLHVLLREEAIWLETRAPIDTLIERLQRHVIADDVEICDVSSTLERLAIEGPAVPQILAELAGAPLIPEPDAFTQISLAGVPVTLARYGWSGEQGYQFFVPLGAGDAVARALELAGCGHGLVSVGLDALEILRIEAGIPRLGCELDETVLPAEARLARALAPDKACYVGQEVVARMASRGRLSHLLVGLVFEDESLPEPGALVTVDSKKVGEVSSRCRSPVAGAIALAFVRHRHAAAGTNLQAGGYRARVVELPFAGPGAPA